mmetsp:Transcript_1528/g.5543  ORF Transcript_1528/g.5543 Transcript_1528/m.5543 type:complete len:235 (-) Transcript_1528:559-1263(-)
MLKTFSPFVPPSLRPLDKNACCSAVSSNTVPSSKSASSATMPPSRKMYAIAKERAEAAMTPHECKTFFATWSCCTPYTPRPMAVMSITAIATPPTPHRRWSRAACSALFLLKTNKLPRLPLPMRTSSSRYVVLKTTFDFGPILSLGPPAMEIPGGPKHASTVRPSSLPSSGANVPSKVTSPGKHPKSVNATLFSMLFGSNKFCSKPMVLNRNRPSGLRNRPPAGCPTWFAPTDT